MKPLALGIIGCGVIGNAHLQAAKDSPLIEIAALADLIAEKRTAASEKYGVSNTYVQGLDLIEDPQVEAVALALPTVGRKELAMHAFNHGKHVIIEKPIAMNVPDLEEMIAAQGDLVAVCCSSRMRFSQAAQKVAEFVASGALGELRVIRTKALGPATPPTSEPPEWRLRSDLNGGGILVNWCCYELDYLLAATGWQLEPVTAFAQTWRIAPQWEGWIAPNSNAETHVIALLRCADGAIIKLERAEKSACQVEDCWEITGSKGNLHLQLLGNEKTITVDRATDEGVITETLWDGPDESSNTLGVQEDFARAIREGSQPYTDLQRSLIIQRITDAVYASAKSGVSVSLAK